jgi:methionyl-tRNA formyltransferase
VTRVLGDLGSPRSAGEGSALRVLLAAEEAAGVQALRKVAESDHRIVAVMSAPAPRPGRGAGVRDVAVGMGIPLWSSDLITEATFADRIRDEGIDVLLNVHSMRIAHPSVLEVPRIGSFNLHPGPLPEYAGLHAPSWAVYHLEWTHGVTLHWMTEEIDAGPVAYVERFPIGEDETGLSVSAKCVRHGLPLVERLLRQGAENPSRIPRVEQDRSRRRYFGRGVPQEGAIRWEEPAERIAAFVRACDYSPFESPWGHPRARWRGENVEVIHVSVTAETAGAAPGTVRRDEEAVLVAARDRWIRLRRLRFRGRSVSPQSLLTEGFRLEDGAPAHPESLGRSKGLDR